ncbi:MAG: GNAT family N-acetyltransferase, partial [Chloroflexi bacterium]|nr:GNAT family N-acetyltransferase [Chloroflexota bacterium]
SFSFARFMADTRFPRDQAVDFYERWMRNMCHDLPDTAYVMEIDGRTVGFYISRVDDLTERMGLRVGRMILAAIDPTLRGQGIGFDLTRNTVAWLLEKADIIEGAVITRNAPMFNLLTELGFQVRVPRVTLHHWTEKTHE